MSRLVSNIVVRMAALVAMAALLVACSGAPVTRGDVRPPERGNPFGARPTAGTKPSAFQNGPAIETPAAREEPLLILGNDQQVRLVSDKPVRFSAGGAVSLKFEQAPVTEVVHAVLGEVLKLDYTIHQPLTGEVTLHSHSPLPPDQLLSLLESVLQANGILLVRDATGRFHVGKPEALKGLGSAPRQVGSLPSGYGIVIVPLQYVGAAEMAEILRPVANPDAFVRIDTVRNLLVLAGPRNQLDNWLEFVSIFDVDMLKGMSVGLFPLEHVSVQEMAATLRMLTGGSPGETASSPPAASTAPTTAAAALAAARNAARNAGRQEGRTVPGDSQPVALGPFGGPLRILPIERMNALLVVTPRAHFLTQVREWIERFDQPRDGGGEAQLYVYPVQNGTAPHLANLLNAIFGGTQQQTVAGSGESGVAPALTTGTLTGGTMNTGTGSSRSSPVAQALNAAAASAGGRDRPSVSQVTLPRDVRVVADEFNNALLIHAPRSEYRKIVGALRRLDIAPTQILIEASILEVTLTDETRFGLQWFLEGGLGGGWTGTALLTDRNTATIGSTTPGFSYTITNPVGQVRAVLNALAQKSLLNVISSPSVMVQDNHTAAIHVGDQQPILASTTVTDGGTTISSIQYKDTGVILSVTPSANSGGMVSLSIRQAITDVGPVDSATGQRSFLQREVSSRVAVRSGDTLVLGGLIRDNNSRDKQGVPILHEIPFIGPLFGATNNSAVRTELLVMITPRVVRSDQDVRDMSAEMRRRMQGLKVLPGWERFEESALPEPEYGGEGGAPPAVP